MAKIIHAFNSTNGEALRRSTAYEALHPHGEVLTDSGVTGDLVLYVYAQREDIPAHDGDHSAAIFTMTVHENANSVSLPTGRFIVCNQNTHVSIDSTPYNSITDLRN